MQDIKKNYFNTCTLNKALNLNNIIFYKLNFVIINIFNKLRLNLFIDNK